VDRWACVDIVAPEDLHAVREQLEGVLWRYSPRIEPSEDPRVYWLDASGLGALYPQLTVWAHEVGQGLRGAGFVAQVVVGFSRFGTYAAARAATEHRVFATPSEEQRALGRIPLSELRFETELLEVLDKLGVRSVADFVKLPEAGLLARFGKAAHRLHRMAAGELLLPMDPKAWDEPLLVRTHFDDAETDATRLLFSCKRLLDALLPKLVLRGEAIAALALSLTLDRAQGVLGPHEVRPAVPTLEGTVLLDLLRLRLETLALGAGVVTLELAAQGVVATAEQLRVFSEEPTRDLAAAGRALARLRAELGEDAVVVAALQSAHLPEASFVWQRIDAVRLAEAAMSGRFTNIVRMPTAATDPSAAASLQRRPLVRRLYEKPPVLHNRPRHARDDGWLISGPSHGAVMHEAGPFLLSGGWWVREVQRDYRFVLTRRGDLLWVYYDRKRHKLCLQAEVQ
jgi:protein ImuB